MFQGCGDDFLVELKNDNPKINEENYKKLIKEAKKVAQSDKKLANHKLYHIDSVFKYPTDNSKTKELIDILELKKDELMTDQHLLLFLYKSKDDRSKVIECKMFVKNKPSCEMVAFN